jgi:transposase InsO family protein
MPQGALRQPGLGLKAKCTRAYRPQTNGKAERFTKTLQEDRAYAMPFNSQEEHKRWLLLFGE